MVYSYNSQTEVCGCVYSQWQSGCVWPGAWSIHTRASQRCSYVHGLFIRQSEVCGCVHGLFTEIVSQGLWLLALSIHTAVRGLWLCAWSIHTHTPSGTVSDGMCGYVNGLFTATVEGGVGVGGGSYLHIYQGMVYQGMVYQGMVYQAKHWLGMVPRPTCQ